jgi:acetyl esterase/lipase
MVAAFKARRSSGISPDATMADIDIVRIRGELESLASRGRLARDTTVTEVRGPAVDGDWVTNRAADPARTVLWLHGGAHCVCSPRTHRRLAADVSRAARARVFLPDYRLAPEHPYPAAHDDAVGVWRWLLHDQGVDPSRTVVGGDSSGGGLALALLVTLRDLGEPLPAACVLLSPWVDLTGAADSWQPGAVEDPMLTVELAHLPAGAYVGDVPLDDPRVSPLYADLHGLPPMLVHAGTLEALIDDCRELVRRAREAGVEADLGVWHGLWHVFQAFPGFPEGRRALQEVGGFVRRHTDAVSSGRGQ